MNRNTANCINRVQKKTQDSTSYSFNLRDLSCKNQIKSDCKIVFDKVQGATLLGKYRVDDFIDNG